MGSPTGRKQWFSTALVAGAAIFPTLARASRRAIKRTTGPDERSAQMAGVASPGPGATTATTAVGSSRSGLAEWPRPDLPPMVELMRMTIAQAAHDCDFDMLEGLAFAFGAEFVYSFDEPTVGGCPALFWRGLENGGENVASTLARLLEMPYAEMDGLYVWPSAALLPWSELPVAARESLRRSFGDTQVSFWDELGTYMDYRIGISEEGDWRFFIPSD